MTTADNLRISLVQTDLYWEDIPANLASLEEQIARIGGETDLIILPEMFSTGFSMEPEKLAEPLNLVTTRWLRQIALSTNALIMGSFIARDGKAFYNRLIAVFPNGTYEFYDKRHLFRMGGENEVYCPGNRPLTLHWKGWNIRPLICYDLRFPVWSRFTQDNPYDLLVYTANWPASRNFTWETLLKARAIENLSYVAGVNRLGIDGRQIDYVGNSMLIDFKGQEIKNAGSDPQVITAGISLAELHAFRQKFPAYLDADSFEILG